MPIFRRMVEIRFLCTKILTLEIRLNPKRYFLTLYKDIFLSLSPFWASVMAPLGHWTSTHTGLPQNVVPLFLWLPIGIPEVNFVRCASRESLIKISSTVIHKVIQRPYLLKCFRVHRRVEQPLVCTYSTILQSKDMYRWQLTSMGSGGQLRSKENGSKKKDKNVGLFFETFYSHIASYASNKTCAQNPSQPPQRVSWLFHISTENNSLYI